MCVVSMVMDHYRERWQPCVPVQPFIQNPQILIAPQITAAEVEEFRKLLERAREYDRKHNEPDCELDEKKQAILTIAKQLGVEIAFL